MRALTASHESEAWWWQLAMRGKMLFVSDCQQIKEVAENIERYTYDNEVNNVLPAVGFVGHHCDDVLGPDIHSRVMGRNGSTELLKAGSIWAT